MNKTLFSVYEQIVGSAHVNGTADPPVLLPPSETLLVEIVRRAYSENHTITVVGGSTFPTPLPLRDGIVVSTAKLYTIKEVNPEDFVVIAQAGARVDDIVRKAEKHALLVPLDITSGAEATLGGAYMTGATAPSSVGYGALRASVIGVRCITAQGNCITGGGRTTKNVTGYDIPHLLTGTMGLFAIAGEVTLKVHPLPETRTVVVGRFHRDSNLLRAICDVFSQVNYITMLELIAPDGLGGEVTLGIGLEGMETLVQKNITHATNILTDAGAGKVYTEDRETFMELRRKTATNMTGDGFITISVPSSLSVVMMKKILAVSSELPVIAHPAIGRFHTVCSDAGLVKQLKEASLSLGGKCPVEWSRTLSEGISHLFTEPELKIARLLKHELDPSGKLNPHVKLL
ncbi:FAD-binding oxidoreductase [Candidatus Latescibacterota bacterium]